jgi:serine/threonine protein kinase
MIEDVFHASVEMLVLSLAVCASTPTDCLRFSQAMQPQDRLALKRLTELAAHNGFVKEHADFVEHATRFLRPAQQGSAPSPPGPIISDAHQTGSFLDYVNTGPDRRPFKMNKQTSKEILEKQSEDQKQLMLQQQTLVDTLSAKLADAQQMRNEETELLKSFRKIVTREVDANDKTLSVQVSVVERDIAIRQDIEDLCEILEFDCNTFADLDAAMLCAPAPACKSMTKDSTGRGRSSSLKRGFSNHSVGSSHPSSGSTSDHASSKKRAAPVLKRTASNRSVDSKKSNMSNLSRGTASSRASASSRRTSLDSEAPEPLSVVLLGSEWLMQELPSQWKNASTFIFLTSQLEEFEEVGRKLDASGRAEITDHLRERGISEYLLHPITLQGFKDVVTGAMCQHIGHDFLLTQVMGRGTSGVVYKVRRLRDGAPFALKVINTRKMDKIAQESLVREIALLKTLDWPTLTKLVDDWYIHKDRLHYLQMPLLENGDIAQQIINIRKNDEQIELELATDWYAQTLHGLSYLHASGVLHRDIKPGNLLLTKECRVVLLADLGEAVRLPGPGPHPMRHSYVQAPVCTPLYAAPESLNKTAYPASDIWSVGATFYEVLSLKPLFSRAAPVHELQGLIAGFDPQEPGSAASAVLAIMSKKLGPDYKELCSNIRTMLQKHYSKRPSAATLAVGPGILQRLKNIFVETGFVLEPEEHFEEFTNLLNKSIEADSSAADPGRGSWFRRNLTTEKLNMQGTVLESASNSRFSLRGRSRSRLME